MINNPWESSWWRRSKPHTVGTSAAEQSPTQLQLESSHVCRCGVYLQPPGRVPRQRRTVRVRVRVKVSLNFFFLISRFLKLQPLKTHGGKKNDNRADEVTRGREVRGFNKTKGFSQQRFNSGSGNQKWHRGESWVFHLLASSGSSQPVSGIVPGVWFNPNLQQEVLPELEAILLQQFSDTARCNSITHTVLTPSSSMLENKWGATRQHIHTDDKSEADDNTYRARPPQTWQSVNFPQSLKREGII